MAREQSNAKVHFLCQAAGAGCNMDAHDSPSTSTKARPTIAATTDNTYAAELNISTMVQEYIPPAVLVIILLSIRLDRASFRNFVSVTLGAATAWAASPGNAISYVLLALAVAISPLGPPLHRAALKIVTAKTAGKSKSSSLSNPNPINILHDTPDAIVE